MTIQGLCLQFTTGPSSNSFLPLLSSGGHTTHIWSPATKNMLTIMIKPLHQFSDNQIHSWHTLQKRTLLEKPHFPSGKNFSQCLFFLRSCQQWERVMMCVSRCYLCSSDLTVYLAEIATPADDSPANQGFFIRHTHSVGMQLWNHHVFLCNLSIVQYMVICYILPRHFMNWNDLWSH